MSAVLLCLGLAPFTAQADTHPDSGEAAAAQIRLIEGLYRAGDGFRAETEVLRFLHAFPSHPSRPAVELVRAKLYYGEGRFRESALMLISLLDRLPGSDATPNDAAADATRLLALTLVRQGRLEDARPYLAQLPPVTQSAPPVASLKGLPPDAVEPERAARWSTWLPGSGFFLLGQPTQGFAALGLNLLFTSATVWAWQQNLQGAALVFFLTEWNLYRGGSDAARQAAQANLERLQYRRRSEWAQAHGETPLLAFGLRLKFGGP